MTGTELFANQAQTTVSSGGTTAPSSGTSETWTVASSSGFPAASSTATPATFFRVTDRIASSEKMIVTNVSGTTWTVTRGAEGTSTVAHSSGFTVENIVTAAALNGFSQAEAAFANILDYGADPSGNTDSTSAIAAAITAVTPADGVFDAAGTVFIPGGQYITQPIVLPQRVGLLGAGFASTLVLAAGSPANSTLVSNAPNAGATGNGAQMCFVSSLRLDGNNSHRSGNWDNGIVFTNTYTPTYPYEYSDARHLITNVNVQYFTGDGIVINDSDVSDCNIWSVGGFGFATINDANFVNCSAGGTGLDGFVVPGSCQLTNCKAWYSGVKLTSGQYSGQSATALTVTASNNYWGGGSITYTLAEGYGNGFLLGTPQAGTAGPSASGNFATLAGCYAQDNCRAGYLILQPYANLSGCTADSNSNCGTSNGTSGGTPVGSFAGFDMQSAGSIIEGFSYNRSANLNQQAAGLHVSSGTGGKITLGFGGQLNDGSNMPPLMAGDTPQGVDLQMYHMSTYTSSNQGGGYFSDHSFATGTYSVDPFWATTWDLLLSGNITLANPAMIGSGANTTGTFLYQGMKLRYIIRQGATAYTVSWGGAFVFRATPNFPASSVRILDFVYDGTNWQQVEFAGGTIVAPLTLPAGTATAAPLTLASGTLLTTAAAGAVEYDGTAFYLTGQASSRQVVDAEQLITLTSTYTLTSQTAVQKMFNSTANGALTVEGSTAYFFECFFSLSSMSASSGAFGFALGGTATLTAQLWQTEGNKATLATAASAQNTVNTAANTAIVSATTGTAGWAKIWGKVRVNAAGTLIPQVSLGVAAAAVVGVDSYFRIWPAGAAAVTNVGNWS